MRVLPVFLILAALGCSATPPHLVAYLVRHGEKVNDEPTSPLTEKGQRRAEALARILRCEKLDQIHSTGFKRTLDTAKPTADLHGLQPEVYHKKDLPDLARRLRQMGGRHLIVGHSNTTHDLVGHLGGDPGPPIDDKKEFDRLYTITVLENGETKTVMERYGDP